MPNDDFENLPPCSWEVAGKKIIFPIEAIREHGGNRIIENERAYRDGAKLDDTGSKAKVYELDVALFNGHTEPGLVDGDALYPQVANDLVASFDAHEVGTLTLPTKGPRRCRAEVYDRSETFDQRGLAFLKLSFKEDNEEAQVAFQAPSARSTVRTLAAFTFNLGLQLGALSDDLLSLTELAGQIEALANAPGEFLGDLITKAHQIDSALGRIEGAFTKDNKLFDAADSLASFPAGSSLLAKTRALRDTSARVVSERMATMPRIVTRVFKSDTSLVSLSAKLQQSLEKLMAINPGINPLRIEAGTPVKVYDKAA